MSITHTKVSAVPDGVDTSLVLPSDWNADHTLTAPLTVATISGGTLATDSLTLRATTGSATDSSAAVIFQSGANGDVELGRLAIYDSTWRGLWLSGFTATTDYVLLQRTSGGVLLNCPTGETISFGENDNDPPGLVFNPGLQIGSPTGGDLGAGTLNVENQVRTGPLTATGSASAYPLVLDNTATTSRSWRVGPSTTGTGNFAVFRALDNAGVYVAYGDTAWTANSDARMKQDVTTLADGLGVVTRLRPVAFRWKDRRTAQAPQVGFLAQEVQTVAPLAVRQGEPVTVEVSDTETIQIPDALGVSPTTLIPYLVGAIQAQQQQIEALTQAVAALQAGPSP